MRWGLAVDERLRSLFFHTGLLEQFRRFPQCDPVLQSPAEFQTLLGLRYSIFVASVHE